ncbi:ABC transporter ATP-binding protein [Streptomyces sp. NPDC001709]
MEHARANPVTGRVLVLHEPGLAPAQVALTIRRAAAYVAVALAQPTDGTQEGPEDRSALTPARPAVPRPASGNSGGARHRTNLGAPRKRRATMLVTAAATTLFVGCGKFCVNLVTRPLAGLGLATAATVAIVRKAWHRSPDAQRPAADADRRHPLTRLLGPHKRKASLAASLSVSAQIVETSFFVLLSSALLLLIRGESTALAGLGIIGVGPQLLFLAAGTALAAGAAAALTCGAMTAWQSLGQTVEHDWRTRTYARVQRLAPAELEGERTSRVTSVLTEDINQIGAFIETAPHEAAQLATSVALLVPALLLLAPQVAWVAFALIPLMAWLSFRYQDRAVTSHALSGERRTQMSSHVTNTLQANTTVKASCTEDHEADQMTELSQAYCDANRRTARSSVVQTQIVRASVMSALPATLLIGGRAVLRGEMSATVLSPLIEMPGMTLSRLSRLGPVTDQYRRTLSAFERVERLHALAAESATTGASLIPGQVTGTIALEKVSFAYPGRPPVLCDLSLRIPEKQVTAIVGPTGAGKTTIAKLLMRFRHAEEGRVLLDGADVRELSLPGLRHAIGYVSQEPFLFDATIAENIRYGTFDATHDQLVAAARTAGADCFINALPDGYATLVGERGAALSGGQRQRIALARTVLRDPPVVILDEATSAVDNETEAAIQQALQAFGRNHTLIVIAHRLSSVRDADRIYVLDRAGRVAEQGTHNGLVRRGGLYAALWKLQSGAPGTRQLRPPAQSTAAPTSSVITLDAVTGAVVPTPSDSDQQE